MSEPKTIRSYRAAKWTCLAVSVLAYFLPFIVVAACLIPGMQTEAKDAGQLWAVGIAIIILNSLPFIGGCLRHITAHFPMMNFLSFFFLLLYGFFTLQLFREYVYKFCWIEFAALVGSVVSCVFWHFYRKNKRKLEIAKTNKEMGVI